jgi:hypothetical protein
MNPDPAQPPGLPALRTPVVFLVFNRPDCTARSLAAIRAARPAKLYVVADGPRAGRPGEAALCGQVRALVEEGVDWPCEVVRDYAPANLGLAQRVSSGLDAVFARESEAIILEDDCVPDPTFFPFCAELLERYRDEPRVAQISGCTFQDEGGQNPASYYFSRYPHCWGWATWSRAWRHYDHAMTAWPDSRGTAWLDALIPEPAERRMWESCFDATAAGRVDSWAYRWTLAVWRHGSLSIQPYRNLVANIGFGAGATHTHGHNPAASPPVLPMRFPLVHPASLAQDAAADERTSRRVFRPAALLTRLARRLRRIFA